MQNLANEWVKYVTQWNKEQFDTAECLGCDNDETLEKAKYYIIRNIKDWVSDFRGDTEMEEHFVTILDQRKLIQVKVCQNWNS